MFSMVYSDPAGNIYDEPAIESTGFSGSSFRGFTEKEMIPLPPGTVLSLLPGRLPVGKYKNKVKPFRRLSGIEASALPYAVSGILPNGYTRLLLPAYRICSGAPCLPLFSYSSVAFKKDNFYIAACETEKSERWLPSAYTTPELEIIVKKRLSEEPDNRLLKHLSFCALNYQCYNAQNIFYGRWEGGIPLSGRCNSHCLGCLSQQDEKKSCFTSPQNRIAFTPSIEEVISPGVRHLNSSDYTILSFGQGCEGEPLLQGDLLIKSIREIRKRTSRGTLHLNTNGSKPGVLTSVIEAGLDSVRISLISAIEENYKTYFRPRTFSFKDVCKSFSIARDRGIFISINLLVMPGFTDRPEEMESFFSFLEKYPVNKIQFRNLNLDPHVFFKLMPRAGGKLKGMLTFIELLKRTFPSIKMGSVNSWVKK